MTEEPVAIPPSRKAIETKLAYVEAEHQRVDKFRDLNDEWSIIVSTYEGVIDALKWVLEGGELFKIDDDEETQQAMADAPAGEETTEELADDA